MASKDTICRYCLEPIAEEELALTRTYWQPHSQNPCHKKCKVAGEREEALVCQTMDADCNDCRHFVRGASNGKGIWNGTCSKFSKPTKAYAVMSTGRECFEHRRDAGDNVNLPI